MQYKTAKQGRIFVCKLDDGDDLLKELSELCIKEDVRAAFFHIVGGIKGGDIVVGPETEDMPPKPVYKQLTESHEATGMGTIFYADGKPKVHFHGTFGKKNDVKMGCLRNFSEIFLILEVIVIEIEDIEAIRQYDAKSNFYLLTL
ncbi:MAG: DNA-binding protein [Candidatus Magnetoovum sp. WYHC-5]|nr:DNA-binding protein [Candidatus Magnetoovum sp. WYHC-5]